MSILAYHVENYHGNDIKTVPFNCGDVERTFSFRPSPIDFKEQMEVSTLLALYQLGTLPNIEERTKATRDCQYKTTTFYKP